MSRMMVLDFAPNLHITEADVRNVCLNYSLKHQIELYYR